VPIVEPEVLIDGDHSMERAMKSATLSCTPCSQHSTGTRSRSKGRVEASMVLPEKSIRKKPLPIKSQRRPSKCCGGMFPRGPTINFLSGGQTPEEATAI
jgi:fructose-bisphosphate aldolase class I